MSERGFHDLAADLERLEAIVAQWPAEQQGTVTALRSTLEAIQAGAFRSLVRTVKTAPGGTDTLLRAIADPWLQAVLTFHGVLRPPEPSIEAKVEKALDTVRPALAGHAGNVELVRVVSSREVHIKLTGTCDGCAFSEATVRTGIETAIRTVLPELDRLEVVGRSSCATKPPNFASSPFDRPWHDVGAEAEIVEGRLKVVELREVSLLLTRIGGEVKAYPNACTHLGMPLDAGQVQDGVLTCPYHGFRYELESGECLTAPEVQLMPCKVRINAGRVQVQVPT